jgi:hypothetical protein
VFGYSGVMKSVKTEKELVAMNAIEQYFNAFAVPLGIESDGLRQLAEKRSEE